MVGTYAMMVHLMQPGTEVRKEELAQYEDDLKASVTELLGIITASSARPGLNADEKALYEELKGRSRSSQMQSPN
jgi:hypothetical protein